MLIHEFRARTVRELKGGEMDDDYRRIQWVYENCPLFDDVNGKDQIAAFYDKHGLEGVKVLFLATERIMKAKIAGKEYADYTRFLDIYAPKGEERKKYFKTFCRWATECERMGKGLRSFLINLPE